MAQSSYENGPLLLPEELAVLESVGRTIHRTAGHVFFGEGEETDFALLVRRGHVLVKAGSPQRIIAVRHAGDMVGEMAAVRRKPRVASVVAYDSVEALYLSATQWLQFLYAHPRAMHAQLVAAEERLDQATKKIVESDLAVEQRFAKGLLDLVDNGLGCQAGAGPPVVLRFGQQDLAALSGASVDSIKKIIRTFKAQKIVDTRRQAMIVLDPIMLRDIASGDITVSP